MSQTFDTAPERDFFDADDYEERAETFDALHRASERSLSHRRAGWIAAVATIGFVAPATWGWMVGQGHPTPTASAPLDAAPHPPAAEGPSVKPPMEGPSVKLPSPPPSPPTHRIPMATAQPAAEAGASTPAGGPTKRPKPRAEPTPALGRTAPARPRPRSHDRFEDALRLHDTGRSEEALARIGSLGEHPDALVLGGSIHQQRGDAGAARKSYERYLRRYPSGAHARSVRAILSKLPRAGGVRSSPSRQRARRPREPAAPNASPPRRVL